MVLSSKSGSIQTRFLAGFIIILVCFFGFYITRAIKLTPELMLKPETVKPLSNQCRHVRSDIIGACIPADMGYETVNGSIRFFSSGKHISGLISKGKNSGYEMQLKSLLNKPFNRMISGDLSSKNAAEIMKDVFEKRYNPVFFGVRADIVPRWMRGDDTACIIFPEGSYGIGFVSSAKQMGLVFDKKGLIVIQIDGSPDKPFLSFLMGSVTLL
jgi:hypothetical protein